MDQTDAAERALPIRRADRFGVAGTLNDNPLGATT